MDEGELRQFLKDGEFERYLSMGAPQAAHSGDSLLRCASLNCSNRVEGEQVRCAGCTAECGAQYRTPLHGGQSSAELAAADGKARADVLANIGQNGSEHR